jgi:ribosomal protein S18 acetylase RimI-like enzyme
MVPWSSTDGRQRARRAPTDRSNLSTWCTEVSIDVRLLKTGDDSVLARVAPDVFDDPIDRHAAARFLSDPRHLLAVAVDAGIVVGFASAVLYEHPDKPCPELWINEVGVAPAHQRRGIGQRLINALLDAARRAGCHEAWVLTDRSNDAAIGLYASTGGHETPGNHVMFTFPLDDEAGS